MGKVYFRFLWLTVGDLDCLASSLIGKSHVVIRGMLGTSDEESKMRFKNKDFYL
ncbi:hypothetical protein HanXRQr2_Chr14g0647041 [Helianthus annuus]|uniref:Uncharacterized protein n=1 Tax=Helianthus annuus TaxID=4232 RepID=A0A9K3EA44_HELAN|nr:hypothetical protein HanXRQr2_Chr14g0647041 [Helianthus annuus]KAJ0840614.1 hypothetical protein HanPSC8_Chr14g0620771 [Helianthus annuus]